MQVGFCETEGINEALQILSLSLSIVEEWREVGKGFAGFLSLNPRSF